LLIKIKKLEENEINECQKPWVEGSLESGLGFYFVFMFVVSTIYLKEKEKLNTS